MAFFFYYVVNQIAVWFHEISSTHFLSQDQCVKFSDYILEACSSRIHFMNSDEIIPWGFQETAERFSIERDLFNFTEGFSQIWKHTLHHYSGTFLCDADFIPDRSCLDVPVGRKCSACNGLAPEFLYELPNRPWRSMPWRQQVCENADEVSIVFDGLYMEYCRKHYQEHKVGGRVSIDIDSQ